MSGAAGTLSVDGKPKGCAFVIGSRLALTANHLVRGRDNASVEPSSVSLVVAGRRADVTRIDSDLTLDVAVLHLAEEANTWLSLGHAREVERWTASTQFKSNDPQLDGVVTALRRGYRNQQGHESVGHQLQVNQDLEDYGGYSGSPVESPAGVVVGVLVEHVHSRLGARFGEPLRAAPVLYTTPVEDIVERFALEKFVTWARPREGLDPSRAVARFSDLLGTRVGSGTGGDANYMELLLRARQDLSPAGDAPRTSDNNSGRVAEAPPAVFAAAPAAKLLILGEGGAGKTTALLKLGLDAAREASAQQESPIPVYVPLNLAGTAQGVTTEGLLTLLAEQAGVDFHQLHKIWLHGPQNLLFLLDGLNEVRDALEDDLIVSLQRLTQPGRHRFIITSRPTAAAEKFARQCEGLQSLDVVRLTEEQVNEYLAQRGLGTLSRTMGRQLRGLARNPFMLWALVQVCAGIDGPRLPTNTGQLYKLFIDDYTFGTRELAKTNPGSMFDYPAVKRPALASLAAHMTMAGSTRLVLDDATLTKLSDNLEELGRVAARRRARIPTEWTVDDFLDEVVYNGVLNRSDDTCTFMHESVQTYFTAVELATWPLERVITAVPALVWRWVDVDNNSLGHSIEPITAAVVMMTGLKDATDSLVDALAERNPLTAARCLGERSAVARTTRDAIIERWVVMLAGSDKRACLVACHCLALARVENRSAINALLRLVHSDDKATSRWIRNEAIDALAASPSTEASDKLRELALATDEDAKGRAGHVVTEQPTPQMLAQLIDAWRNATSDDQRTRAQIVIARISADSVRALLPELQRRLDDDGDVDRAAAVREVHASVQTWRTSISPSDLKAAWYKGAEERTKARQRLLAVPFQEVLDTLVHGTANERQMAAVVLAAHWPSEAIEPLLSGLWRESGDYMARRMADALGECNAPASVIECLTNELKEFTPAATLIVPIDRRSLPDSTAVLQTVLDAGMVVPDKPEPERVPDGWRVPREHPSLGFFLSVTDAGVLILDGDRRARAALALARMDPEHSGNILVDQLRCEIERMPPSQPTFKDSESIHLICSMVELLGDLQWETAAPLLLEMLQSEMHKETSALVLPLIESLSLIGARESIPIILRTLAFITSDANSETGWGTTYFERRGLSAQVQKALERFGANDQILDWLRTALSHSDARIRIAAVRELGAWKTLPRELASIVLTDPDIRVRKAAAETLRWYRDGPWLDTLLEGLAAPEAETREAAAQALGAISDPYAIDSLAHALKDDHERVRLATAESLVALSTEAARDLAVEPLLTLARDKDGECRVRAGTILLHLLPDPGTRIPADALKAIVVNPHSKPDDREHAFNALGGFEWPALADTFNGGDPKVVSATLSRLIVTPDGKYPPYFERIARWKRGLARAAQGEFDTALADIRAWNLAEFFPTDILWLAHKLDACGHRSDAMHLVADALKSIQLRSEWAEDQDEGLKWEAEFRLVLGWLAYRNDDRDTALLESDAAARLTDGQTGVTAMFNLALAQLVFDSPETALATYSAALERCDGLDAQAAAKLLGEVLRDLEEAEGRAPRIAIDAARALMERNGARHSAT
jgi:HEAT repeat protein